jgi:hypothetical protein
MNLRQRGGDTIGAGENNYNHVLNGNCTDPDCELHRPAVIEDENDRLTACAWFLAGAFAALNFAACPEWAEDSDTRWDFLGDDGEPRNVETDLQEDR